MKQRFVTLAAVLLGATLLTLGCTQAAPAPTPTKAAAVPTATATKAAEPTKPAAPAAPTAAPAAKVDFPQSGRSISYIVPFAPGGSTDISARLMTPYMEKGLGVPVQVTNKPGGDTQVAMTELVKSKPDGYTIGTVDLFACILTYLQPERQAIYTAKDFLSFRMFYYVPAVWIVNADSPYKSLKDLVDAAKAKPESIKVGDTGLMGPYHLSNVLFEKTAGVRLTLVHFDGAGPAATAVLGGHIDAAMVSVTAANASVKAGQTRILGVTDKQRTKFFPDAPTFEEQGYKTYMVTYYSVAGPAGIPKGVADILGESIKKAQANEDLIKKTTESSLTLANMGSAEVAAYWTEAENQMKESLDLARQEGQTK